MPHPLHLDNRRAWDQAARAYRRDLDRAVAFLRAGGVSLCPPELRALSGLASWCGRAIHLQCAGGEDTLSLWNLGAREVVGLDISPEMIAVAEQTAAALGAPARFVCCDVLDAPEALWGTADLVYTGKGALVWLHDLTGWAQTVARLLRPDGRLYLYEGHPVTYLFSQTASSLTLDPDFRSYFPTVLTTSDWGPTYIGDLGEPGHPKHEVAWPLSLVIQALLDAGLQLRAVAEHPEPFWTEFPNLPDAERARIPNTWSLWAIKPG